MTNKQAVLYISYDGMTDPLGQSQVLPYLCGLSAKGYSITLLSCEKPERYQQHRSIIENICATASINWQPIPYTSRPPVLSTIKDVWALQNKAFALHRQHSFSIVHCRSYISALIGQTMKKKFGTKFLFDMRGFWADERVDGGLWNLNNPLYKTIYSYFKRKEKEYLEQADHIISLTHAGKEEIHSWKKVQGQPVAITVIPCCVDTALFDPATITVPQQQALLGKLNITPGTAVIGYVGSIGTWYMLDEMLQFFKIFRHKNSNAILLFVTTEPEAMVKEAAERLDIPFSSIIVQPAARKEVPLYISIMNYSLFFIKPRFSKIASSPTKQGEIMAMGVPALCNTGVGDTGYVVHQYHSGIAVDDFSEATFTHAADALQHTAFSVADIRKGAIEFYGLEKGIALYESAYQQL